MIHPLVPLSCGRHYVTEVDAESPADGKLDVGDEIKAVNGDTTQSMTHEDVRYV